MQSHRYLIHRSLFLNFSSTYLLILAKKCMRNSLICLFTLRPACMSILSDSLLLCVHTHIHRHTHTQRHTKNAYTHMHTCLQLAYTHTINTQVMEVFQQMVRSGCERSVITYSTLISACEKVCVSSFS